MILFLNKKLKASNLSLLKTPVRYIQTFTQNVGLEIEGKHLLETLWENDGIQPILCLIEDIKHELITCNSGMQFRVSSVTEWVHRNFLTNQQKMMAHKSCRLES